MKCKVICEQNIESLDNTNNKSHSTFALFAFFLAVLFVATMFMFIVLWRTERLRCFCTQCGNMAIAKRSFLGWSSTHPSNEVEYQVEYTRPTIFSNVFNAEPCCMDKTSFRYNWMRPGVGIAEDRFLIIEGYYFNLIGIMLMHSSCFGIGYYFDCPEIGSPLSKASEKGLAFQEFLLNKKKEDPEIITSLQKSFSMSRHTENKIWQDLLVQFENSYPNNSK